MPQLQDDPRAEPLDRALDLLRSDCPEAGLALLRDLAAAGDPRSAYEAGLAYERGRGGPPDAVVARRFHAQASAAGHPRASFRLAALLERGRGGAREPVEAVALYVAAARQGSLEARLRLSEMTRDGDGLEADPVMALAWLLDCPRTDDARLDARLREALDALVEAAPAPLLARAREVARHLERTLSAELPPGPPH